MDPSIESTHERMTEKVMTKEREREVFLRVTCNAIKEKSRKVLLLFVIAFCRFLNGKDETSVSLLQSN